MFWIDTQILPYLKSGMYVGLPYMEMPELELLWPRRRRL